MNYPTPNRVTLSAAPDEVRAKAAVAGLTQCEGWSSLWFKSCCGKFVCMEEAAPHGSPRCMSARDRGLCRRLEEVRGSDA
jgi:hypothetical protein